MILVRQNEEIKRIFLKILRFKDLQAASALVECLRLPVFFSRLFRRYPVIGVDEGVEDAQSVFEAFFGKRAVYDQIRLEEKRAKQTETGRTSRTGRKSDRYLALSYTGLSAAQIENYLDDPQCAVLLIVCQQGSFTPKRIRAEFSAKAEKKRLFFSEWGMWTRLEALKGFLVKGR